MLNDVSIATKVAKMKLTDYGFYDKLKEQKERKKKRNQPIASTTDTR